MENWLREFIDYIRSEVDKSPELKMGLSNLDWFLPPCQVIVLWFLEPEVQAFIVTHFNEIPDLTIEVYGPKPAYEFFEIAEAIMGMEWWNLPLTQEDKKYLAGLETYRDVIEEALISIKSDIERAVFVRPTNMPSKYALTFASKDFLWLIRGNFLKLNAIEMARRVIEEARRNLKCKPEQQRETGKTQEFRETAEAKTNITKGFAAYIYPFLWIGEVPKLALKQRLRNFLLVPEIRKKVLEFELLRTRVILFNDGFLYVKTGNENLAIKIINLIAASLLLNNIKALACRNVDLIGVSFDKEKESIVGMRGRSLSRRVEAAFDHQIIKHRLIYARLGLERVIDNSVLVKIIETVNTLAKSKNLTLLALSLVQAYTHLAMGNYREAFLSGWFIIEYHVNSIWESLVESEAKTRERISKLRDPNYMSLDHVIEFLNITGNIDDDLYAILMRFKRLRNRVVHELYDPSVEEVKELLNVAYTIVDEFVRKFKNPI